MGSIMTANTRHKFSWWLLAIIVLLITAIGGQLNKSTINDVKKSNALKEAKQWQQVIEDCDTAFIVFDSSHEIIQWNRGAQSLLGWSESEAVGAKIELIIPIEKYKKDVWSEQNLNKLLYKTTEIHEYLQHKDGKILHTNIRIMTVVNSRILYVMQIVRPDLVQYTSLDIAINSELVKPYDIKKFRIEK